MQDYVACLEATDRVLYLNEELSSRSDELSTLITSSDLTKAHFRKSMGLHGQRDLNASLEQAEKASVLSPADPLIQRHLKIVQKEISERSIKEKKMYAKMFA